MIEYQPIFHHHFDACVDELYKEGLQWAYDSSVRMPMDLITSGVAKSRVSLDVPTFIKSFYFWKTLIRKENLPLPPMKRILPLTHSFWNVTKHGSDVKTKYIQSKKTIIPNNNMGAKAFDRMLMIIFSEIHRGSVIYTVGTHDKFKSLKTLYDFREKAKQKMTFRLALNRINNFIMRKIILLESPPHLKNDVQISNIGIDTEMTYAFAKETCLSPKRDHLNRLTSKENLNDDIFHRFNNCDGKPIFRVSDIDKSHQGPRARGQCIVCNKRTNWYCALCRNFACHNKSDSGIKYLVDAKKDSMGHRIMAVKSCFMQCHPNFL